MTDYGGDLVVGSDVRLARLGATRSMHVMVAVVLCAGVGGSHFLWRPQLADVLEGSEVRGWADPVLVEVGTSSLREERTKKSPPHG
ncbi:hypothetical protein BDA96_10G073200 [Sorghum bicolor]|uniref:Uncharacterized protein n=2 Tax=Sorghum bicolor TaxID=4558 RepID=A0A921Q2U9_SORBI|nr:hypothetical protein BDA96_10G073200 [Sorghum bicolor]KAG0513113.1 hypothetical protein BDA96_10G073200 [Sorghum bicolor]KXG19457.1 hypothetical protein SORBI_3010G061600 [Sorghum bicolor]